MTHANTPPPYLFQSLKQLFFRSHFQCFQEAEADRVGVFQELKKNQNAMPTSAGPLLGVGLPCHVYEVLLRVLCVYVCISLCVCVSFDWALSGFWENMMAILVHDVCLGAFHVTNG